MDGFVDRRTIGYGADSEISYECLLLCEIHSIWDVWSIGTIGPGWSPRVGHKSDVFDSRDRSGGQVGGSGADSEDLGEG